MQCAVRIAVADPAGTVAAFAPLARVADDPALLERARRRVEARAAAAGAGAAAPAARAALYEVLRQFYRKRFPAPLHHAAAAARAAAAAAPPEPRVADAPLGVPPFFAAVAPLVAIADATDAGGDAVVAFFARRAALLAVARRVAEDPVAAERAFDDALASAPAAEIARGRADVAAAALDAYADAERANAAGSAEPHELARAFHRAFSLFECLAQFGAVPPHLAIKATFAKYASVRALR